MLLNIPGEAAGREDGASLMWRNKCFREVDRPSGFSVSSTLKREVPTK